MQSILLWVPVGPTVVVCGGDAWQVPQGTGCVIAADCPHWPVLLLSTSSQLVWCWMLLVNPLAETGVQHKSLWGLAHL